MAFFTQEQVDETAKEAEKKNKSFFPVGVHLVKIKEISCKPTKDKGYPMIGMIFSHPDHYDLHEYWVFNTDKPDDVKAKRLIEFFVRTFGYKIKPVPLDNPNDTASEIAGIYDQVKQFQGKEIKIAVQHQAVAKTKVAKSGTKEVKVYDEPKMWYAGSATGDLTINKDKAKRGLSDRDKAILKAWELKKERQKTDVANEQSEADHQQDTENREGDDQWSDPDEGNSAASDASNASKSDPDDDLPF